MENILFDASPSMRTFDDNGFLHVAMSNISKANVCPYLGREIPGWQQQGLQPNRIYYGLRDPEELAKAAPTFDGLPLLENHHQIDAENPVKEYTVGSTGTDATFDGTYLKNSLTITDAEAIKAVEDGRMKEISCAYRFTPDFTAGTYGADEIHYDFVMRNISGNHVALVAEGRAGKDVAVADSLPDEIKNKEAEQMPEEKDKLAQDAETEEVKAAEEQAEEKKPETEAEVEQTEAEEEGKVAEDAQIDITQTDAYKAGFEAGVASVNVEVTADSIPAELKAQIIADSMAQAKEQLRALNAAAIKVKPLVGAIVDPMAFDSADAIYKFALEQSGKKADEYPSAAYAGMVDMLLEMKPIVADAKPSMGDFNESTQKIFAKLNEIR